MASATQKLIYLKSESGKQTNKLSQSGAKLKDRSDSRERFGAYNDPMLTQESNFATTYVAQHMGLLTEDRIINLYKKKAAEAKRLFKQDIGLTNDEFKRLMGYYNTAVAGFSSSVKSLKSSNAVLREANVKELVKKIQEGHMKDKDIEDEIYQFKKLMYGILNCLSLANGTDAVEFSKETIGSSEIQSMFKQNKLQVETWLKDEAPGAATTLKNLYDNFEKFLQTYEEGVKGLKWEGTTKTYDMDKKSANSYYGSFFASLKSINGGIAEKIMAKEIALSILQGDEMLRQMLEGQGKKAAGVTGSAVDPSKGKFGKEDVVSKFLKDKGTIIDVKVNAKAKERLNKSSSIISFETGGTDLSSVFRETKSLKYYEPYSILSHYRNISGYYDNVNKILFDISSYVGAKVMLEAFGADKGTHFVAFQNEVIAVYELINEMVNSKFGMFIGTNDELFINYKKYDQLMDAENYVNYKGGEEPSWKSYKTYVMQKDFTQKVGMQTLLGFRKQAHVKGAKKK